jgi:hypothetical protein
MKKYWGIIGAILITVTLTGCSNNSQSKANDSKTVTTHKVAKASHKKKTTKSNPATTKSATETDTSQKETSTENQNTTVQNTDSQKQDSQSQNSQSSCIQSAEELKQFLLDHDLFPNPRDLPMLAYDGSGQFSEYKVYSDEDYNDALENKGEFSPEKTVHAKYSVVLDMGAVDAGATNEVVFLADDNNIYYEMYDNRPEVELDTNANPTYQSYYGE